jgi:hypothetical protein
MPYQNYPQEAENLEGGDWMTIDAFSDWLNELETVNFSLQEGRNKGQEIFNSRQTLSWFFSNDLRFPDKRGDHRFVVICLDNSDWPSILEQISSALDYKTPDVSKTDKDLSTNTVNYAVSYRGNGKDKDVSLDDEASKKISTQDERTILSKALKAYRTGLQKARSQKTKSAVTMRKFEATYALTWQT